MAEWLKEAAFDLADTAVPRRFYVTTKLLKEHGFSAKCEGRRAVLENKPKQTHSEECRRRILEAIGKHDPRLVAQRERFDSYLDKAAAKEDFQELEKMEREKKRMRPEETVPDVPSNTGASSSSNNTGASSSSGSKEAQEKRGGKRAPEDDGRADLDEAQLEMARQAAEAGLAIARTRGGRDQRPQ